MSTSSNIVEANKKPPRSRSVTIFVNNREVVMTEERGRPEASGSEIKSAAISQGVNIRADFSLFLDRGQSLKPVGDAEVVEFSPRSKFRAVAPDDNSSPFRSIR